MTRPMSLLALVGVFLGGIGIIVCAIATLFFWIVSIRVGDVAEKLFNKADQSLVAVRGRVVQTKDLVAAAKISTNELEEMLRSWTKLEVKQRVVLNLNVGERTARLASSLRQADDWLAVSLSSVE